MNTKARIILWGTTVGYASLGEDGYVRFEYDQNYLKSNIELSPLMMPLKNVVYSFKNLDKNTFYGLPGLLYDSLPDKYGNIVIDQYLISKGKDRQYFNIIDRLCYIGNRGMGAICFEPTIDEKVPNSSLYIEELVNFANSIVNKRKELTINIDENKSIHKLFLISSSAGGARAKAIIAYNKKTKEIKSGQLDLSKDYEHYIIKFDGVNNNGDHELSDTKDYTKIEYVYYLMAIKAKIDMSYSFLLKKDGLAHFVTKRFDRINNQRLHMQTYASLAHIDYNIPHLISYEMLIKDALYITKNKEVVEKIYRRMVFNVLAFNNDDHVKNFSFLMDKDGKWSLSPAYDMTFAYDKNNRWLNSHQMLINDKYENITYEDLLMSAKRVNLSKKKAVTIISEVKEAIALFRTLATREGISDITIDYIESFINHNLNRYS